MRKIAFCLISFLTLSLPCTMSWGETYAEKLNGLEKTAELRKTVTGILGDIEGFEKARNKKEIITDVQPMGNYLVVMTDEFIILLTSGGNEGEGLKFLSNDKHKNWRHNCKVIGMTDILNHIRGEEAANGWKKIKAGESMSDEELTAVSDALERYYIDVAKLVIGSDKCDDILRNLPVYDADNDSTEDTNIGRELIENISSREENFHLKEYLRRNTEGYATDEISIQHGLALMKSIKNCRDRGRKINLLYSIAMYLDSPTTWSAFIITDKKVEKNKKDIPELVKSAREIMRYGQGDKWWVAFLYAEQAANWLKRCTHTEVLLKWLLENGLVRKRANTPIISWRNPCQSCARLPWLAADWCEPRSNTGFYWVDADTNANKQYEGVKIKNEQTKAKITEWGEVTEYKYGKPVRSVECNTKD